MSQILNPTPDSTVPVSGPVSETAPVDGSSCLPQWRVVAILAALALLLIVARIHTYNEPLERDLTSYAVYAHELLHGRDLYTDIWDHKPPMQFATFAIAELIVGYGRQEMFFLNIVEGLAAMLGLYFAGRAVAGQSGGLAAAACWVLAGGSMLLEGNQPNTELGINAWTAWAVAVMWGDKGKGRGLKRAVLAGVLFAVASTFKHVVVLVPMGLCLAWVIDPPDGNRRRAFVQAVVIGAAGAACWGLVFAYFAATHRLGIFYAALFTENAAYAGSIKDNLLIGLAPPYLYAVPMINTIVPLIAVAMLAVTVTMFVHMYRPEWVELRLGGVSIHALLWMLAAWAAVTLPGRYYPHYYQNWLLPVCLAGAWGIVRCGKLFNRIFSRKWFGAIVAIVVLGSVAALEGPNYRLSADEWSFKKYGEIFVAERDASRKVSQLLGPGETLYNWGNEMGFYFYTGRRPPVGEMSTYMLWADPLAEHFSEQVLAQLQVARPELVVFTRAEAERDWAKTHPVYLWLLQNYRIIPGQPDDSLFVLGYLKGGALEKRLSLKQPGS